MKKSDEVDKLIGALVEVQKTLQPLTKNKTVKVRPRAGSEYSFDYATFDNIIEHVREELTGNGLWFTQTMSMVDGALALVTTLFHSSGQWISSDMPVMDTGRNQEFGAALTYRKRYALAALLGLAADEDADAGAADGEEITSKTERPLSAKKVAQKEATARHSSSAASAATAWGKKALAGLMGCKSIADYDAWATHETLKRVAQLKDYDSDLHDEIEIARDQILDKYNPVGA